MICPACSLAYNKNRKPYVLGCGHSLCQGCLGSTSLAACRVCSHSSKPVINFALYQEVARKNLNNIDKYIRVCLFGNMSVGKSSILSRLVSDEFQLYMTPTIGIDFKYVDKEVQGRTCRFQIWDSAGQERFRSMSSHHLKGSHIILLVYDVSRSHEQNQISYWIDEIQNYANHNNVIVVGNKTDLLSDSEVQKKMTTGKNKIRPLLPQEQIEIANLGWTHVKVSCLSRQNMDQVWELLLKKSRQTQGRTQQDKARSVMLSDLGTVTARRHSKSPRNNSKCC